LSECISNRRIVHQVTDSKAKAYKSRQTRLNVLPAPVAMPPWIIKHYAGFIDSTEHAQVLQKSIKQYYDASLKDVAMVTDLWRVYAKIDTVPVFIQCDGAPQQMEGSQRGLLR